MDALYVLGTGSKWNDFELQYSLRSLEKHVSGIDRVFIVGNPPKWKHQNLICHEVEEPKNNREHNIAFKILWACENTDISHDFLFVNDDHFFLQDIEAAKYPFYHIGLLQRAIDGGRHNSHYRRSIQNTIDTITELYPHPTLINFDCHYPIIYNKFVFRCLKPAWDISAGLNHGLLIKSMYCNFLGRNIQVMPTHDCKIDEFTRNLENLVSDWPLLSVGDRGLKDCVGPFLQKRFPEKSKYEV